MNVPECIAQMDDVSKRLMEAHLALSAAAIDEMNAETTLEIVKAKAIVNGEIQGKNEEERKARISTMFSPIIEAVHEKMRARIVAQNNVKALENRLSALIAISSLLS